MRPINFYDDDACVLKQMVQVIRTWSAPRWETDGSYHTDYNPSTIKCKMRASRQRVKAEFIVGFGIVIERRKVDHEHTPFRRDAACVAISEVGFDEDFRAG